MTGLRILSFVLAGGAGTRLRPFTDHLPKPALPFGGSHRIIDLVLSNLYHSQMRQVYILTQYRPQLLLEHIARYWAAVPQKPGDFIMPVLPDRAVRSLVGHGTANAVYQCLDLIDRHSPDIVAVFAADQVYRMDIRQMIHFHLQRQADLSVAAVPVPLPGASRFGIIRTDQQQRIRAFREKPSRPEQMPDRPDCALASTGNYLFHPDVLIESLRAAAERGEHDFGQNILPRLVQERKLYAYDLSGNFVPGRAAHEEVAYWRDLGDIESYAAAHRDLMGPRPRFALDNPSWPILGRGGNKRGAGHSILGQASLAAGAVLRNSVLQAGVTVEPRARLDGCIVMDGATIRSGVRLRNAIVGAASVIDSRMRIGYDPGQDRELFTLTPGGMVLIPPFAHASPGRTWGRRAAVATGPAPGIA